MKLRLRILNVLTFCLLAFSIHSQNLVTYAGGSGKERFNAVMQLSNGTVLVAGGAEDLNWIPTGVPKTPLSIGTINSTATGRIGFVMQLSSDLSKILQIVYFPQGSVRDILKIRTTNVSGQATGDLFISGTRDVADYNVDGYFIAKLNNNFVKGTPTATTWTHDVVCKPRQAGGYVGESQYKTLQPWDVGSDGKVVFSAGSEYDFSWAEIRRLSALGKPEVVENWTAHWSTSGEWDGTPAASYTDKVANPLNYSAIVLKIGRKGSLRSWTQPMHDQLMNDGNGNATRKGAMPDDYFFSGPCPFTGTAAGSGGYTGYKPSDKPTARLGEIVIDRRTNHFYFGYSTQSVLPSGLPDFEPVVVAMDNTGKLKWWNRLYQETTANSTPDQYVDDLAIDYKTNSLVVAARCHGNNTINFWRGNEIKASVGAKGFQNQFTGTNGNIHISWLGKLTLDLGTVKYATYVAEYNEGATNTGAPLSNNNMEGWPDPNGGWPNLNTTRISSLNVAADGSVSITAVGRRTMTTRNAFQKMPKVTSTAKGTWNNFVRTYAPDLSRPLYSSVLTGKWDTISGAGGGNIELKSVFKIDAGLLAVGYSVDSAGRAVGLPMPTIGVPTWGNATPVNEQAVFARLTADSIKTIENVVISDVKTIDYQGVVKIYPNPTSSVLNVELENIAAAKLEIVDVLGKVLYTEGAKNGTTFAISTMQLQNGFYFLRVLSDKDATITVLKFMKN